MLKRYGLLENAQVNSLYATLPRVFGKPLAAA
jgi:hypothetical protein